MLYKVFNHKIRLKEWIVLNFNQNLSSRQKYFKVISEPTYKVGNHILSYCLSVVNKTVEFYWLNLSTGNFKIKIQGKIYIGMKWLIMTFFGCNVK